MTAIAWDGTVLAGDRMCTDEWVVRTTTKVRRIRGHLVGGAGNAAVIREALAWFERGAEPADFPESLRDKDDGFTLLAVSPDGRIWLYQRAPYPIEILDECAAIGSGADAALAAMHCGCNAEQAIGIAAKVCRGVGNGVDVLELQGA
jgi:ATP-dependent protease HslVU (ClpYQ) peptidase subunit